MDQLFIDSQPIINDEETSGDGTGRPNRKGVGDEDVQPKSGFKVLRTNIGIEITNLETPTS